MGNRAGVRRAEDAPGSAAGQQAGAPAERDAGGGDPGDVCVVAGSLRGAGVDGGGGRDGGAGPGSVVLHGLPAYPALPAARERGVGGSDAAAVVRRVAVGDERGTHRATPQSHQPAGGQTQDVQVPQETSRASPRSASDENLCRVSGYDSLNGIAASPPFTAG